MTTSTARTTSRSTPRASPSARRQAILDTAATVFATRGFAAATVRDVGSAAGILSGSLYHHFESKDQMLEEILRTVLTRLVEQVMTVARSDDADEQLRALILTAFEHSTRHPEATTIVENDYAYLSSTPRFAFIVEYNQEVRAIWTATLVRGIAQGYFRPDLNIDAAYITMMGAIASATRWRQSRTPKRAAELAGEMTAFFLDGIGTR